MRTTDAPYYMNCTTYGACGAVCAKSQVHDSAKQPSANLEARAARQEPAQIENATRSTSIMLKMATVLVSGREEARAKLSEQAARQHKVSTREGGQADQTK